MELKTIANDMLPVYESETGEKLVDARLLHQQLMSKQEFSNWIKRRVDNYGFVEGEDFLTTLSKSTGGRPSTEYLLLLDTGKEIAMLENNEQGRAIRKYFIEVEKRYRTQQPKSAAEMILQQAELMVEYEKRINQAESNIAAAHHRIDNMDKIDTLGDKRQRLNKMVQRYANEQGIQFQQAWKNFRQSFNTAYRENLTMRIENYKLNHNLKRLSMPEYLEQVDRLDDAIRVADKLLNQSDRGVM